MIGRLLQLFFYIFYVGLIYTFFTPEHAYLNMLDNARTFYLWVHIPVQLLMTGVLGLMLLVQNSFTEEIPKVAQKMKDSGDLEKFQDIYKKYNSKKTNFLIISNRIFYVSTAMVVFIGLNDNFLGLVMFWGISIGWFLMSGISAMFKEMNDALK